MTLILTALTRRAVVLAADRRLTWPDGSIADDDANKMVCGNSASGPFIMAYAGLAEVASGQRTDDWLLDHLVSSRAATAAASSVAESLASARDSRFKNLVPRLRNTSTCVVLAGLGYRPEGSNPFFFEISNTVEGSSEVTNFSWQSFRMKAGADPRAALLLDASGWTHVLSGPVRRRINKLQAQRFFTKNNPDVVAEKLVSLIRTAADSPEARAKPGGESVIGKECLTAWINPLSFSFESRFHSLGCRPEVFGPHLYQEAAAFKGLRIWTGSGPPGWWNDGGSRDIRHH
jgi:hypothetical protein